jgi:hypothetical protein
LWRIRSVRVRGAPLVLWVAVEEFVDLTSPRRGCGWGVGRERGAVEELQGCVLAPKEERLAMWGPSEREDVAGLRLGPWAEYV